MQKKMWTWEDALANELFYDYEEIDFSLLYPSRIPCVYINGESAYQLDVLGSQMKGEICLGGHSSIGFFIGIEDDNTDEEFLDKFGKYVAEYVLSVEESGILVTYKGFGEKFVSGKEITILKFSMSFKKEIIVKFSEDDQKVYLEYPTRNLYTLP